MKPVTNEDFDLADLRWLVGHLSMLRGSKEVPMPPRLVPLLNACIEDYNPSRFTLSNVHLLGGDE